MRREGRPDSAHGLRGPLSPSLGTSGSLLNWREGLDILAGRKIYERSLLTAECLGHGSVHPQSQSLKAERLRVRDQPGLHETLSSEFQNRAQSYSRPSFPSWPHLGTVVSVRMERQGLGGGGRAQRPPGAWPGSARSGCVLYSWQCFPLSLIPGSMAAAPQLSLRATCPPPPCNLVWQQLNFKVPSARMPAFSQTALFNTWRLQGPAWDCRPTVVGN